MRRKATDPSPAPLRTPATAVVLATVLWLLLAAAGAVTGFFVGAVVSDWVRHEPTIGQVSYVIYLGALGGLVLAGVLARRFGFPWWWGLLAAVLGVGAVLLASVVGPGGWALIPMAPLVAGTAVVLTDRPLAEHQDPPNPDPPNPDTHRRSLLALGGVLAALAVLGVADRSRERRRDTLRVINSGVSPMAPVTHPEARYSMLAIHHEEISYLLELPGREVLRVRRRGDTVAKICARIPRGRCTHASDEIVIATSAGRPESVLREIGDDGSLELRGTGSSGEGWTQQELITLISEFEETTAEWLVSRFR